MKKIKLNHGKFALVDDEDFDYLNQWRWRFGLNGYASRTQYLGGGRKKQIQKGIYMHRLIMPSKTPLVTDHINRNKLDNQKINLRIVTECINVVNRGMQRNNTSGFKGVSWYQNTWNAEIRFNKIKYRLGSFKDIKDAISARLLAEKTYHTI